MLIKRCKCLTACAHPFWYRFEAFGRQHRKSTKTANRRLAERIELKAQSECVETEQGIAPPKVVKLSTQIEDYLKYTSKTNVTAYKDVAVLDTLLSTVGDLPLSKIQPFAIERWKSARLKHVSKSTVNRELNIVRGCFSKAVKWGCLIKSPMLNVQRFKVDDQRVRVLSDDELRKVLAINDPFVTLVCRVTLETLVRLSEALHLHRQHIGTADLEIRRKGGRVDRISITAGLRQTLLDACHPVSGLVFGEGTLGHAPGQQTATNRVLRALRAAGVDDASHHTMRHTGVTLMLEKGINSRAIQRQAGWSSLRMLERYGHARDAESQRAVSAIADHLSTICPRPKAVTVLDPAKPEIAVTA